MIRFLLVLTVLAMPAPVLAQEKLPAACKVLPDAHNVVYQPGVDVHGNAVVPADLNSNVSPIVDVLNVIKVPLDVDLAQRVAALSGTGFQMEAPLGMIEIHQDGKVIYNGQDLTQSVMMLCGKSHKEVTVEIMEKVESAEAVEVETKKPVAPVAPIVPEFNEAAVVDNLEMAVEMPSISAPVVEAIEMLKVSQPLEPIKPLIGTPKNKTVDTVDADASDIISGSDYKDHHE